MGAGNCCNRHLASRGDDKLEAAVSSPLEMRDDESEVAGGEREGIEGGGGDGGRHGDDWASGDHLSVISEREER